MPFTTEVKLAAPLNEGWGQWVTVDPLNFHSEKFDKNYVVPRGFFTDLASVPRLPLTYLLAGGTATAAAVLHDWLYTAGIKHKQIKDRVEADEVFFEAMQETEVPLWRCWAMFWAVRAAGGSRFNT